MKIHLLGRAILTLLILDCFLLGGTIPAEAAESGWILSQAKQDAKCTMYICPKGIKYGPDALGVSFVAKGPDWILYKYSDRAKTYFAAPPAALRALRKAEPKIRLPLPDGVSPLPPGLLNVLSTQDYTKSPEACVIAGLNATMYRSPRGRDWSQIYVARDIVVPGMVNELIDYILITPVGIHDTNRVILRREIIHKKGSIMFLDTNFARRANLPPTTFESPKGYRLVKSIDQVGAPVP